MPLLNKYQTDHLGFTVSFLLKVCAAALIAIAATWADARLGLLRSEASVTENVQLLFLVLTIYTFVRFGAENRDMKNLAILAAGFFATAFVRECDGALDPICHGCWVVPALAISGTAILWAGRDWRACLRQIVNFLASPGSFVAAGVILLIGFSRLFGMSVFWETLMQDHYMREIKIAAEECTELFAYGLIWASATLTRSFFKNRKKLTENSESAEPRKNAE